MSKNYTRFKNKVKALLHFYGIEYPFEFSSPVRHWTLAFYQWLHEVELYSEQGNWALRFYVQECLKAKELKKQAVRKIRELSVSDRYKEKVLLLRTVPGIGLINSMKILTEIEDIGRFKSLDKLCSYVGLIPSTSSSGEKERVGGITKRGNKVLKGAIIESAWAAIQIDRSLLYSYVHLKKRMEANKAIIRIARKLLSRIRYVLINKLPYEIQLQP